MSEIVVGISDFRVSNNINDVLVTYALGSCVGVTIYDPVVKVGGLLHFMLPESSLDMRKAGENPAMFADTGIPILFKTCYELGAKKKRMIVKVAGGASILDDANFFRIGQKNVTAMKKLFWKNNVFIEGEDTGSNCNRTFSIHISTGKVFVRTAHNGTRELA
ncbi:MAG: chemotaxis protein CheD [Syntrophales bacterium]|jgi:chemotaxis protein CheD